MFHPMPNLTYRAMVLFWISCLIFDPAKACSEYIQRVPHYSPLLNIGDISALQSRLAGASFKPRNMESPTLRRNFRLAAAAEPARTRLAVGVVSVNVVDAVLEIANEYAVPFILIASRRQIELPELGGGYVNGWSQKNLADYIRSRDKGAHVLVARDHGGPWQHPREIPEELPLEKAMDAAKISYRADIEAGFHFIHIDPSLKLNGHPTTDEVLQRVFELYTFCCRVALQQGRKIQFEVGTDEQGIEIHDPKNLDYFLSRITKFCDQNNFPRPIFVVVQTGTKVMELANVGILGRLPLIDIQSPLLRRIEELVAICRSYGISIKGHNTDYLSDVLLALYPAMGIDAANVAPEFATVETRAFLRLMEEHGLQDLHQRFVELVLESRSWEKWMLPDSRATSLDKTMIGGHYLFSDPRVMELKQTARTRLHKAGIELDAVLKAAIKQSIMRYLRLFNLLDVEETSSDLSSSVGVSEGIARIVNTVRSGLNAGRNRPLVIGIGGEIGSGKTWFARRLGAAIATELGPLMHSHGTELITLGLDDLIIPRAERGPVKTLADTFEKEAVYELQEALVGGRPSLFSVPP